MPRSVLHCHKMGDGWEASLNHPEAVVIDYPNEMLLQGTRRYTLHRTPNQLRFMAFMLRGADLFHARAAVAQAVFNDPNYPTHRISDLITKSRPILAWLGMSLETVNNVGLRLHTDPRETLRCNDQPASSQPPPTHVRPRVDASRVFPRARSHSLPSSMRNAWKHTRPRPPSSESADA